MATIKSYTDIKQSRKLAEILPIESADMHYYYDNDFGELESIPTITEEDDHFVLFPKDVRCWTLASLLDIVKTYSSRLEITLRADKNYNIFAVSGDFVFRSFDECSEGYNNIVDACYEVIIKLYELKML